MTGSESEMARKKRKQSKRRDRDVSIISRRDRLISPLFKRKKEKVILTSDKRRFHPNVYKSSVLIDGSEADIGIRSSDEVINRQTRAPLAFFNPEKVEVCVRRKRRRETLFAKKKVGRGKRVQDRRRWREESRVKC